MYYINVCIIHIINVYVLHNQYNIMDILDALDTFFKLDFPCIEFKFKNHVKSVHSVHFEYLLKSKITI
jgi:hypothetical protein